MSDTTRNRSRQRAARALAKEQGISYVQALRLLDEQANVPLMRIDVDGAEPETVTDLTAWLDDLLSEQDLEHTLGVLIGLTGNDQEERPFVTFKRLADQETFAKLVDELLSSDELARMRGRQLVTMLNDGERPWKALERVGFDASRVITAADMSVEDTANSYMDLPPISDGALGIVLTRVTGIDEAGWRVENEYRDTPEGRVIRPVHRLERVQQIATRPRRGVASMEHFADLGEAGLVTADPDWGKNEIVISAGDAMTNIFHALTRMGLDRHEIIARAEDAYRGDSEDGEPYPEHDAALYPDRDELPAVELR